MSDLARFLLARIDEDEAVARAAVPSPWIVDKHDDTSDPRWSIEGPVPDGEKWPEEVVAVDSDRDYNNPLGGCGTAETAHHIARWDPARVLAECAAKRQIVSEVIPDIDSLTSAWAEETDALPFSVDYPSEALLRLLALPYADHADYDPAWRPEENPHQ